ncbi:hypothetical protein UA75_14445 [Actinoalloteichus sp. GBA129-24]|nr:hypothetical protein UA75_14445 [Actinoalloteichus sp. GBA129-24]
MPVHQHTALSHPSVLPDTARRALAYPGLHSVRAICALLVPAGEIVPPGGGR